MSPLASPEAPVTLTKTDDPQQDREAFEDIVQNGEFSAAELQGINEAERALDAAAGQTATDAPAETTQETATERDKVRERIQQVRERLIQEQTPASANGQTPPTPPAPAHPQPPRPEPHNPGNDQQYDLIVVDQTEDARKAARAAAEQRLSEEAQQGGFFKKIGRAMWKNGVAHEWYRQKYIREAYSEIVHHQDVLRHTDSDQADRERSRQFLLERFKMGGSYISGNASQKFREQRAELDSESQLSRDLKGLVEKAVKNPGMTNDEIQAEFDGYMESHRDDGEESLFGEGAVTSQNILQVVEQMRGVGLHGESLLHAVANMRIITGESRSGSRTEAHYNKVDRVIEKLAGNGDRKGLFGAISPELVASGIALGVGLAKVSRGAALHAAGLSIPIVTGYAFGALRAIKKRKDETVQHERESEFGKVFDLSDKRRRELDERTHEKKSVTELLAVMQETTADEKLNEGDEALKAALQALTEAYARKGMYDQGKVVVSWSDEAKREEEFFYLSAQILDSRNRLYRKLDPETRSRLGIAENATFDDILASDVYIPSVTRELHEQYQEEEKAQRKWALRGAIGKEALMSAGVSGALTGVGHVLGEVLTSSGGSALAEGAAANQGHGISVNGGYSFVENQDGSGSYNVTDSHGNVVIDHLQHNPDGTLPSTSQQTLEDHQFHVSSHDTPPTYTDKQVSIDEYLKNHPEQGRTFDNVDLFTNGTAAPDLNELGGQLTYNPDGSVNVWDTMKPGGSFNPGEGSIDMSQLPKQFDIAITQPDGTHIHKIFEYGQPIDKPWADMLYQNSDGTWGVKGEGNYIAWGKVDGDNFDVAASIGGTGEAPKVTDHVMTSPGSTITEVTAPPEHAATTHMPGVVWTVGSESLAPAVARERRPETPPLPYYYDSNRYAGEAEASAMREEVMPELLENPGAEIPPRKALDHYKSLVEKNGGPDYLKEINEAIDSSPELREIPENLHQIVGVLVNASGESESNNIYNVLANTYAQQDEETLDDSMILLHVNWYDDAMSDEEKAKRIAKTRSEIERAKADFPGLKVAVFESEWERARYGDRPIIGYAAKRLEDVTLLALQRAMEQGNLPDDRDVLFIRNDADPKGMHRNYLRNYANAFEQNPEIDIFTGTTSFDNSKAGRLPGMVFAGNFMQNLDLLASTRDTRTHTGGANFAVKSSIQAAIGGIGFTLDAHSDAGSDDVNVGRRIRLVREGRVGEDESRGLSGYVRSKRYQAQARGRKVSKQIAKRVVGARIDTDSDRSEQLYLQGIPIIHTWDNGFSDNGYKDRKDADLEELRKKYREDIKKDPRAIVEHIRMDMEASLRAYEDRPGVIRTALTLAFSGLPNEQARDAYKLTIGHNGDTTLEFTETGINYLVDYLQGYGERKQRQMYGRNRRGKQINPRPMMLAV